MIRTCLAACFLLANVAAQSPPPPSPPPLTLPPLQLPNPPPPATYLGSSVSKTVADAIAFKQLSGKSIRCADFVALRSGPDVLGDGFFRVKSTSYAAQAAISAAPLDSAVPMNINDIDGTVLTSSFPGVNVQLLLALAASANFTVTFDVYRTPDSIYQQVDKTYSVYYLLQNKSYDCITSAIAVVPYRLPYMQFSFPIQPSSFTVITQIPTVSPPTVWTRFWTWKAPFSDGVWGVIFGMMCGNGLLMAFFEYPTNKDDFFDGFGDDWHTLPLHDKLPRIFWNGIYLSLSGFTGGRLWEPGTVPGRILSLISDFVVTLVLAFFTGGLAASFIASTTVIPQTITGVNSFSANNLACCMPNTTGIVAYMTEMYPSISRIIVGTGVTDVIDAVNNGTCAGGVMPDVAFKYAVSTSSDPAGNYCSISRTGEPLDMNYYAIPFSLAFPYATVQALQAMLLNLVLSGQYEVLALIQFPDPALRSQCANYWAEQTAAAQAALSTVLYLPDLAGIFAVNAGGMAISVVIFFAHRYGVSVKKRLYEPEAHKSRLGRGSGGRGAESKRSLERASGGGTHEKPRRAAMLPPRGDADRLLGDLQMVVAALVAERGGEAPRGFDIPRETLRVRSMKLPETAIEYSAAKGDGGYSPGGRGGARAGAGGQGGWGPPPDEDAYPQGREAAQLRMRGLSGAFGFISGLLPKAPPAAPLPGPRGDSLARQNGDGGRRDGRPNGAPVLLRATSEAASQRSGFY